MDLNEVLVKNITFYIEMYGLTESECLSECKIHSNFMSNLKSGKLKKPAFEDVYKIAKFFRVSLDQMICYIPENDEPNIKYHKRREARIFYNRYRQLNPISKQLVNELIIKEIDKN